MHEPFDLSCPFCRQAVHVDRPSEGGSISCPHCGASIPIFDVSHPPESSAEHVQPSPAIHELDLPTYEYAGAGESHWRGDLSLKPRGGETLAVLALLIPVIALCLPVDTVTTALLLGWGTVIVTTILLTIDAASMGTIDLDGNRRLSVVGLFIGMFLLWVVFYPVAFFRRRHFGRPNLGLLGILVAGIFVIVPFFKEGPLGEFVGHKPPACTNAQVMALVDNLIRKAPIGPSVKSITGHREIRYDEASNTRKGRCLIQTRDGGNIGVVYTVSWVGQDRRAFQVQIEEEQPAPFVQPIAPPP